MFTPGDATFAERFYKIVDDFDAKFADYQSRANALADDDAEAINLLLDTCKYMREQIDYVFGPGTSQLVFGDTMVIETFAQFFDGIAPFFKQARGEKIQGYLPPANGKRKPKKPRTRTRK